MDPDQEVASNLLGAIASPDLRDVAKDIAESLADSMTTSDVLKEIPLLSTLAGLGSAASRVRDVFLARKLMKFMLGVAKADEASRQRFFEEHCATPKQRLRLSGLVLHILDDLREEERVGLVAALFVALLEGTVHEDDFSSLCDATARIGRNHIRLLRQVEVKSPCRLTDPECLFLQLHILVVQDWTAHAEGPGPRFVLSSKGASMLAAIANAGWC